MREENERHNADVEKWAKEQRQKDIEEGRAPMPIIASVADSIKNKLLNGDIHGTAEREAEEERLINGGQQ